MIRNLRLFAAVLAAMLIALPAVAGSPALWRLSDHDSVIWLFGTVHLLPRDVEWRSPAFEAAFAAADTIYLETDVSEKAAGEMGPMIQRMGLNPDFKTLSSILGSEDNTRLARAAARVGIPPGSLEPMRPWFAAMMLTLTHLATQGYDPRSGVETAVTEKAVAAGKRLRYLESASRQFEIFANLSLKAEKAFLMSSVEHIETDRALFDTLVRSWAEGDTETLDRVFREALGATLPEINEAVFLRRNREWSEHIARTMAGSGKTFIAVGAGHLSGQQGIVAMLRNNGYNVTRQ